MTAHPPSPLHIRPMQPHELLIGIDWAAQEGWNPGLHDSASFYAADPNGFLLAELDGEAIGMISAVRYGEHFGFIGFYIVKPDYRGRGHGLALWHAAMHQLKGRLVGLDGVLAQQDNYRQSGFILAYNNVRMQGIAQIAGPVHPGIVPLADLETERVLQYDQPMFPADRARFLRQWITQTGSVALGLVHDGTLYGYGVIRPCREGYKVGPLFTNDATAAHELLNALMHQVPSGAPVQLDIAAEHSEARALATAWHMQPVFETARMYTGAAPRIDLPRQFGITTFELG